MGNGDMVRKYLRRERQRRGWTQTDLAKAAGIKSRTTIRKLEDGFKLTEGVEGAVEEAVGWRIGSLDIIRNGGEPIYAEQQATLRYPNDLERQAIWDQFADFPNLSDDDRADRVERIMRVTERRRRGEGGAAGGATAIGS